MKRFEEIAHTADWSFRAFGRDLRELFENAAYAMFAMEGAIPADAGTRPAQVVREVEATGTDRESLLVSWLNELLYLQDTLRETYYLFEIQELEPTLLKARVSGMPGSRIDKLIKAATYHNLTVEPSAGGWQAVVVVDV